MNGAKVDSTLRLCIAIIRLCTFCFLNIGTRRIFGKVLTNN